MITPKLLIYNLFPPLAGRFADWNPHLERARDMGFTHIFINPFHLPGKSGSIYAIKDFYRINPAMVDPSAVRDSYQQLDAMIQTARNLGLELILDLVINHTACDSPLLDQHPAWFKKDPHGDWVHPGAWDNTTQKRITWNDLVEVDNELSSEKESLWKYWLDLILFFTARGISGFRCDAAYKVPIDLWAFLITHVKSRYPKTIFLAETLGCSPDETVRIARSGFDFVFNSSKYWNFYDNWCLEQYDLYRKYTRTVSFMESHDTPRLAAETGFDLNTVKLRYAFAAVFSSGLMMPIGFEYGFSQKLDVVHTRPEHWEPVRWDLSEYIRNCNRYKLDYPIFRNETPITRLENPNDRVLILQKTIADLSESALIIINKDSHNYQYIEFNSLYSLFGQKKLIRDISPEYELDFMPDHFEYHLRPSQIIILYQKS
ncbi:MAG: alpha-amylase [Candidatus Delongbacteria bacterium]|nr:alpha-amylase [Candidatus Delongbacteria bacterium]